MHRRFCVRNSKPFQIFPVFFKLAFVKTAQNFIYYRNEFRPVAGNFAVELNCVRSAQGGKMRFYRQPVYERFQLFVLSLSSVQLPLLISPYSSDEGKTVSIDAPTILGFN